MLATTQLLVQGCIFHTAGKQAAVTAPLEESIEPIYAWKESTQTRLSSQSHTAAGECCFVSNDWPGVEHRLTCCRLGYCCRFRGMQRQPACYNHAAFLLFTPPLYTMPTGFPLFLLASAEAVAVSCAFFEAKSKLSAASK